MILPVSYNSDNSANEKAEATTTLTGEPQDITLSENLRAFEFSPVETTTSQSKAGAVIGLNGYLSEGATISFSSAVSNATLTASSTPTSGEFWTLPVAPAIVNAAYFEAVAESIADTLSQILSFSSNYKISTIGSNITIEAKEFGSGFDIAISSSSATVFTFSNAGSSKYESQNYIDYAAFARLYVGSESYSVPVDKFAAIEVDSYVIDSAKSIAKLSAGIVGDYVEPILVRKNLTASSDFFSMDEGTTGGGLSLPTDNPRTGSRRFILRPYFFVYGDSYRFEENGQRKRYVKGVTSVKWVQLGAFDKINPYNMNDFVWIPTATKSFNWLTSCPNNKEVTYNSHEFLQVICKKSSTTSDFNIELKCRFYDGSSLVIQKPAFSMDGLSGNISFDVSPLALDLKTIEANNSKLISDYEVKIVWLTSGGTGFSEIKKYKFQRDCNKKTKQVLFLNEFGAWDSLEFRGEEQVSLNRSVKTLVRNLPFEANTSEAVNMEVAVNINTDVSSEITLHSGIVSAEFYKWIKKLPESSSVYIWNEELKDYQSILIKGSNYRSDTKTSGGSLSITYSRTVSNNSINR